MTDLVDASKIEQIVGTKRHPTKHYGRAVSVEETVYILHPETCRHYHDDLRDCRYSRALDGGISEEIWAGYEDKPVELSAIGDRVLVPRDWINQ